MPDGDRLEAEASNLGDLLDSEKEFWSPLFQRLYVWGKEELDRLWQDIDEIIDGEDSSRFLGAIVFQDRSSHLPFAPRSYWIIDGQQRVTTLYLILCAIAEFAEKNGNTSFATAIVTKYLLNQQEKTRNQAKIRPTNRDLQQFARIILGVPPENSAEMR